MPGKLRAIIEEKGGKVHSIAPTATVVEAVDAMNAVGVGALMVLDADQPVGIISERDLLRRVVGKRLDPESAKVADVMTRDLVVIKPDVDIEDAMAVVSEKRVRHLPVVENGKLLGVVSSGDLTRWATRDRDVQIKQLIDFITGKYPS
jgi:CBS domain-containing protein